MRCLHSLTMSILFTCLIMLASPASHAEIHIQDVNSLNDIAHLPHDSSHTLFVFDIDNTLLTETPKQYYIGSPMWFDWQSQQIQHGGPYKVVDSLQQLYPFNDYVLKNMKTVPCEPGNKGTSYFLKTLQQRGFSIIAATAREPAVYTTTRQQLIKANLFDTLTDNIRLNSPIALGPNTFYQHGLLMLRGQDKGMFVAKLLQQSGTQSQYSTIIFVDDTQKNINNFVSYFSQHAPTIHLFTYHYNHENQEVHYFQNETQSKTPFLTGLSLEDTAWYINYSHSKQ